MAPPFKLLFGTLRSLHCPKIYTLSEHEGDFSLFLDGIEDGTSFPCCGDVLRV